VWRLTRPFGATLEEVDVFRSLAVLTVLIALAAPAAAESCAGVYGSSCPGDGNPCTDDICDGAGTCIHPANAAPCDDGTACTIGDACQDGTCVPGVLLDCDDSNVCTDDRCDPGAGCVNTNNSASCDDGDACTTGDVCSGGACAAGQPIDCLDANVCTTDSCDPLIGCVHTDNSGPCDDGNPCTVDDQCDGGVCVGGPLADCDDGNVCDRRLQLVLRMRARGEQRTLQRCQRLHDRRRLQRRRLR
jgi:hypothetical protein